MCVTVRGMDTTMSEPQWIAEQYFRCVARDGEVLAARVRLISPAMVEPEGELHGYWRCRMALAPLADDRWIAAASGFQAICLALEHLRTVLRVFVAEGGAVYWEDTDCHVDISSPWFAPMPSLAELRRRS